MKNLFLIYSLLLSINTFCQTTIDVKQNNYDKEFKEINTINDKIVIRNHTFSSVCWDSRPLDSLYNCLFLFMQNYPTFVFEISSHRDSQGNDKYNLKLSKRIAKNLKELAKTE